jgi:hypothetical protein
VAILAFDVDGTLTDARKPIDPVMLSAMLTLCPVHRVWLVTGSDEPKCREQVGSLFNAVERVYCCAGAEMWTGNTLVKSSPWNPPAQLIVDLFSALQESGYDELTGNHVEIRTGMVKRAALNSHYADLLSELPRSQRARSAFQNRWWGCYGPAIRGVETSASQVRRSSIF